MKRALMPKSAPQSASLVWLISFGDLLTLLVCFFLVLTPWEKFTAASLPQSDSAVTQVERDFASTGTQFASLPQQLPSVVVAEVPIFDLETLEAQLGVNAELKQALSAAPEGALATLAVCGAGLERKDVLAQFGALVQRGIGSPGGVALEFFPECGEMPLLRPITAQVLGVVRLRGAV